MDPVSITCTVGAISRTVFSISWTLTRFIKETKNVNQSVKDLAVEVSGLSTALKAVQSGLSDPAIQRAESKAEKTESLELWRSVNGSLINTRATVDQLDEALEDIRENKPNFAKQAIRQLRLNLKQDEIKSLRAQFRTHISALQMTLMMINVRASCMTSEVTAELGPQIASLSGMIEQLTTSIQDQRKTLNPEDVQQLISSKHSERLSKSAQKILSTASTVYSQSEYSGSVYGEVLDDLSRQRMHEWIPPAPLIEEEISDNTSSDMLSPHSGDSIFTDTEKKSTPDTADTELFSAVDEDDDTGGEFEFEVVERFLKRGSEAFENAEYDESITLIKAGHEQAEHLTLQQKEKLDLRASQLMLATCSYHMGSLDSAEGHLIAYAEQYPLTSEDNVAVQACQASHLLSQVYLRKRKLGAARSHCKKALIGRRRILGKEDRTYFESLFLLSQICEASNASGEAKVYLDMIPSKLQGDFVKVSAQDEAKSRPVERLAPPEIVIPGNGQAVHASVLFDFDTLDPQPEYMDDNNFAGTPVSQHLERNFSSNNPFRRKAPEPKDVLQRSHTDASLPTRAESPALAVPPVMHRLKTTGGMTTPPSRSTSTSTERATTQQHVQSTASENPESVDWSLLWRFVAKADQSQLPSEILEGSTKYITSAMLKKASVETLCKLARSLTGPKSTIISPLHLAVAINHMQLARLILDDKHMVCHINHKCPFHTNEEPALAAGNTALHCAAQYGRTEMISLLVERGADTSMKNDSGYTPLHVAIAFDQLGAVTELFNPDSYTAISAEVTPLHVAAKFQRTAILQVLLDGWEDLEVFDGDGRTPLHVAANANSFDCVEELLQRGADVESTCGANLNTPLHLATLQGHIRVVQGLLSYGARVDARTAKGETALHLSVRNRQAQVFRKLLGYGASIDAQDHEGLTALRKAVDDRQKVTMDILIQRGASLELPESRTSKRPLHAAVLTGNPDVVRMLLHAGAKTLVTDSAGRSPYDLACSLRYTEIKEVLAPRQQAMDAQPGLEVVAHHQPYNQPGLEVVAGPSVPGSTWPGMDVARPQQPRDYQGREYWATVSEWTALQRAAYLGQKEEVIALVNQGVSLSKQTREGYTARDLASVQGHVAIEAFLEGLEMRPPGLTAKFSRLFVKKPK